MKTKKLAVTIILSATLLTLAACSSPAISNQALAATLPVATATSGTIVEGRVEPVRYVNIALNTSGLVSDVLNAEGDQVTAGQVVARLKSNQAQALESARATAAQNLTNAYENLRDAQYALDNFDVPSDFTGQTPAEAVSQTLEKLNAARDAYEPYRYQFWDSKYGYLDLSNSDAYKFVRNRINQDAVDAKRRVDDAWSMYRKAIQWMGLDTDLKTAQANVDQAQKDYNALQDTSFSENTVGIRAALANAEVRAPFAGTITDLNLKVGELASPGQTVMTLADFSSWVIKTTDLTEMDVVNVKQGQPVTVTLNAIPGVTLNGMVQSIAQNYSENLGNIVYEATVLLTDRDPGIRWGMTAEVNFGH